MNLDYPPTTSLCVLSEPPTPSTVTPETISSESTPEESPETIPTPSTPTEY